MSLIGKILIVLNLLALVGFLVLAGMVSSKRQVWSYNAFLHDLALNSLPVDDKDLNVRGRPRVKDVSDDTATKISNDKSIKTLEVALDKARDALLGKLEDPNLKDEVKEQLFCDALMRLAPVVEMPKLNEERDDSGKALAPEEKKARQEENVTRLLRERKALLERRAQPRKKYDDLRARLEEYFEQAKNPKATDPQFQDLEKGLDVKKARIARLLVVLADFPPDPAASQDDPLNAPAWKRLYAVLGAKAFKQALDDQAHAWELMAAQVAYLREKERVAFETAYEQLQTFLLGRDLELRALGDFNRSREAQRTEQESRTNAQVAKVDKARADLTASQNETAKKLEELAKRRDALFEARVKLREFGKNNLKLHDQVRDLEKKIDRQSDTGPSVPR